MKYNIYLIIAISLLISCGNKDERKTTDELIATKNISQIKERQQVLQKKYASINADLIKISKALEKFSGKKKMALVTTYSVKDTLFQHKITIQGNVDTRQNTMLFAEFSGTLKKLYVEEGQSVKKGELIAQIDDSGISQQLAQAQIQYELAKTTFERQERLWNKKIGSEIQFLQAKTQKEALEKSIKQIQARLNKTRVYAPYSGTVDDIHVKRGAMIGAGQTPIARLINLSNMYVRANIPESYLGQINKGTKTQILIPSINKTIDGTIQKLGNFINPNNRTFFIEINIPNQSGLIKPNLMAILEISDYSNPKAIIIPQNIIQQDADGNSYIYTAQNENGKTIARKRTIQTGLTQGFYTEVTKGLSIGELVIDEGSGNMQDKKEIQIQK